MFSWSAQVMLFCPFLDSREVARNSQMAWGEAPVSSRLFILAPVSLRCERTLSIIQKGTACSLASLRVRCECCFYFRSKAISKVANIKPKSCVVFSSATFSKVRPAEGFHATDTAHSIVQLLPLEYCMMLRLFFILFSSQ